MNLNRIRAPLFAFILAEELTRSYLPSYVNQLLVAIPGISPQVVIGLPIMLFMLIVALGQPYLGSWSERVGRRRAMLVGAIMATVGFAGTALAYNLYDLHPLALALRARLRDGVRRRAGLRARPHRPAEPRAGLRALHRRDHGGHGVRPVDRRHPRRQHRLPRLVRRLGADGAACRSSPSTACRRSRSRTAADASPRAGRACARSWRSS